MLVPWCIASALASVASPQEAEPEKSSIEWRSDLRQAQVEARASHRPLLIVFRCER